MSTSVQDLIRRVETIGQDGVLKLNEATSLEALEELRVLFLGKKSAFTEVMKGLGALAADERPQVGAAANEWKAKLEGTLGEMRLKLEQHALSAQIAKESIDISLPARAFERGSLHPVTQVTRRVVDIFSRLGFDLMDGPEVETDFLNFEAVNIPEDHPARDMQDTFFMGPGRVLRTHTTAVQMRAMQVKPWPLRILCPGSVYRNDYDATHTPMFHQIEGLWVDRGVKMSDLKGVLAYFAKEMFGSSTSIRLRPSYFPFVEPGAEVDVSCFQCKGAPKDNCKICKGSGWLEILGAGMVHPKLFETAGGRYQEPGVTGFAFGVGLERIAMLAFEIPDLRLMFSGDRRFLSQF